jgi:hypothetical protein
MGKFQLVTPYRTGFMILMQLKEFMKTQFKASQVIFPKNIYLKKSIITRVAALETRQVDRRPIVKMSLSSQ